MNNRRGDDDEDDDNEDGQRGRATRILSRWRPPLPHRCAKTQRAYTVIYRRRRRRQDVTLTVQMKINNGSTPANTRAREQTLSLGDVTMPFCCASKRSPAWWTVNPVRTYPEPCVCRVNREKVAAWPCYTRLCVRSLLLLILLLLPPVPLPGYRFARVTNSLPAGAHVVFGRLVSKSRGQRGPRARSLPQPTVTDDKVPCPADSCPARVEGAPAEGHLLMNLARVPPLTCTRDANVIIRRCDI